MTPLDLDALMAIAEAAKGDSRWVRHRDWPLQIIRESEQERPLGGSIDEKRDRDTYAHPVAEVPHNKLSNFQHELSYDEAKANATFIATFNPALVLDLLALVREREADNARLVEKIKLVVGCEKLWWTVEFNKPHDAAKCSFQQGSFCTICHLEPLLPPTTQEEPRP